MFGFALEDLGAENGSALLASCIQAEDRSCPYSSGGSSRSKKVTRDHQIVACVLATLAVFIIQPGPHVDFIPQDSTHSV